MFILNKPPISNSLPLLSFSLFHFNPFSAFYRYSIYLLFSFINKPQPILAISKRNNICTKFDRSLACSHHKDNNLSKLRKNYFPYKNKLQISEQSLISIKFLLFQLTFFFFFGKLCRCKAFVMEKDMESKTVRDFNQVSFNF